jgi:aryl-alcohol dehydrogenase-like predicted oxidoreductase
MQSNIIHQTKPDHGMSYGNVDGATKQVSRIVLGSMVVDVDRLPFSFALLDFFFEQGGNCIDTAWVYRLGNAEKCVGAWIEKQAIRDEIVLIGKGAATVHCTPELVTTQLLESLERLCTDYVDIYLMHRDNPKVPVGEFVECLNEHYRSGRIRAFGGSNWTTGRLAEANAYARTHDLLGFAASSPNFSLAVWNEPTWIDCLSASDLASREWYSQTKMPLFAWSSQAARELAQAKGVTPNQIALAYVLCESPQVFALIGPENIDELRQCLAGLHLTLSSSERRWLNLESNSL